MWQQLVGSQRAQASSGTEPHAVVAVVQQRGQLTSARCASQLLHRGTARDRVALRHFECMLATTGEGAGEASG